MAHGPAVLRGAPIGCGFQGPRRCPGTFPRPFEEFFADYAQDPAEILQKTFEEIEGYDGMIALRGDTSACTH